VGLEESQWLLVGSWKKKTPRLDGWRWRCSSTKTNVKDYRRRLTRWMPCRSPNKVSSPITHTLPSNRAFTPRRRRASTQMSPSSEKAANINRNSHKEWRSFRWETWRTSPSRRNNPSRKNCPPALSSKASTSNWALPNSEKWYKGIGI
jgi:hypothetical protein